MKIEKTPSGKYRVRTQVKGKRYCFTFDHRPKESEVAVLLAAAVDKDESVRDTFNSCAKSYIKSKSNVLSPSTIRSYNSILKNNITSEFGKKKLSDIEQIDIQLLINDLASNHKPKTVRNIHGFISAVFAQFRPQMLINTTLPQKSYYEAVIPTSEDAKRILKDVENTKYHIPFQLGMLGMRRSEICAAAIDDIDGNILHINKALVQNSENEWVIKSTKTTTSTRDIYLPQKLVDEIKKAGLIYDGYPDKLIENLHSCQKRLGIEQFRFHDLRHYYVSYAHSIGMSDADIIASTGHKTDHIMKTTYRHAMKESKEKNQKLVAESII